MRRRNKNMRRTAIYLMTAVLTLSMAAAFSGPNIDQLILRHGGVCDNKSYFYENTMVRGAYGFEAYFGSQGLLGYRYDSNCVKDVVVEGQNLASTTTTCDVTAVVNGLYTSRYQSTGWAQYHFNCEGELAGQYNYWYSADGEAEAPETTLPEELLFFNEDMSLLRLVESGSGLIT